MQNSETVLINLSKQALKKDYVFDRIYRNLYNPDFYTKAFSHIYKNDGSATAGVDGQTASYFSEQLIDQTIDKMRNETYQPKPALRVYIPKKDGNKRPLGIPTFMDRIVQEICRMILETIYEQSFSVSSHGFRPNKSCHTALMEIDK
ncbi:group II intron reverse transcriptase/maturase, partial [Bacillus sp. C1-1]